MIRDGFLRSGNLDVDRLVREFPFRWGELGCCKFTLVKIEKIDKKSIYESMKFENHKKQIALAPSGAPG